MAYLALQYFATSFHKWYNLKLSPQTFLILRSVRDMIKMYIGLHVKYALFLTDLNET